MRLLGAFFFHKKRHRQLPFATFGWGKNEFNPDYILGFGDTHTVLVYRYALRLWQQ